MDFKDVEEKYKQLKSQFDAGQISEQVYKDRLSELMIQDEQGRWWMIGYESGKWYYHDDTNWVPAEPPISVGKAAPPEKTPAPEPVEPAQISSDKSNQPPPGAASQNKRLPPWLVVLGIILVILVGILTIHYIFHIPPAPTTTVTIAPVITPSDTFGVTPVTQAPVIPNPTLPSSWNQGQIIFLQRTANNYHDIYILDLQSGSVPVILFQQASNQSYFAPWFFRDGSKFVFEDMNHSNIIYDLRTKTETPFDRCGSPTFSPDGSEIVCGINNNILFYDSAGNQVRSIPETNGEEPVWSPDGMQIAFAIKDGAASSIWRMDTSGNQLIQLTHEPGDNSGPAWSPDGKWIAYHAGQSGNTDIWIMDRDGGGKRQITHTTAGWSFGPAWSPDGKWLAYVSGPSKSDYGEIFIVSLETGEIRRVIKTGDLVYDWRVTWGPKP